MEFPLFYFTYFLFILLSKADQFQFNENSCPASRRLLFFGGLNLPFGEKESKSISSSSSPPKYARVINSQGPTVYIRPQTSTELGQKVRSYSHLLKSKLFTKAERTKFKKDKIEKKKPQKPKVKSKPKPKPKPKSKPKAKPLKKKDTIQHAPKTRDLVAINDHERDRCRALLRIENSNSLIPSKQIKKSKKPKKDKQSISTKIKKKVTDAVKSLPIKKDKIKIKKVKPIKDLTNEKKKKSVNQTLDTQTIAPPPPVKESTIKKQSSPSSPPPPAAPPSPPPPSTTSSKFKKEKLPPIIEEPIETLDVNDSNDIDGDEKNNSVVGRAYYFVKNMFQLSDDMLENSQTQTDEPILASTNEQQTRQTRKLLSINNNIDQYQFDNQQLFEISKRNLLAVKSNKRSTSTKVDKKLSSNEMKPKVGWAYRYRISRYLSDRKMMKRSGHSGGGKSNTKQTNKKINSSPNKKFSKRKLLQIESNEDSNSNLNQLDNKDIVKTVSTTQTFVPKRQLLTSKSDDEDDEEEEDEEDEDEDEETDDEQKSERRRMKSYEDLTDPVEIVRSYDRGLFKPRVGWQFRYRVSRYIDSLRENIREDQERLKLGLQAIKRKTPQELSGRRKRVLDKPFQSEIEQKPIVEEDTKPNVGWRYRYRISKMLEAKQRGDYIDDEEEKRKARLEQKRKQQGIVTPTDEDDECLEWEFDLDPELRKINEEGRRVGWAYRYRIRRKLDELKQIQAETGAPFDLETLGGKREKILTTTSTEPAPTEEQIAETKKKLVGWQYRYRVSKMQEALEREAAEGFIKSTMKPEITPEYENLDPKLAKLTPEQRVVGWKYRYRIRRKLDEQENVTRETVAGKRGKIQKDSSEVEKPSKSKKKEKIIKKVEESIEKILNIDDIDETPFMEYFRRTSSYVLFGLLPTARKSICLLPLPVKLAICSEDYNENFKPTITATTKTATTTTATVTSSATPRKKLRTKKEKRAKQFIHSHSTKLNPTHEKVSHPVTPVTKTTTPPTTKTHKEPVRQRIRSSVRRHIDEQTKHFDEEEQPVKKIVGVDSKRNKNKKKFQILGKEVKIKQKQPNNSPPVSTTRTTTQVTIVTTTNPPPIVTTSLPVFEEVETVRPPPPVYDIPETITSPPPPPPSPELEIDSTTSDEHLRSISEILQEEASTLLSTTSIFTDESKEEINESNEDLQTTSTSLPIQDDKLTSNDEDDQSNSSDSENDSDEESDEKDENYDPTPMQKIKQFYENTKETVHDVFDLENDKDSS